MYIAIYIVFGIIKYSENNINVKYVKIHNTCSVMAPSLQVSLKYITKFQQEQQLPRPAQQLAVNSTFSKTLHTVTVLKRLNNCISFCWWVKTWCTKGSDNPSKLPSLLQTIPPEDNNRSSL